FEDRIDLLHVLLADDLPQADRADLVDRDHDPHPVVENAQYVERLALTRDLRVLDAHHLAYAVAGVDRLVALLELLHSSRLLEGGNRGRGESTGGAHVPTTPYTFDQPYILTRFRDDR